MTPLPQRKKTPEEIAQLREQMGVPESDLPHAAATIPAAAQPKREQPSDETPAGPSPDKGEGVPQAVAMPARAPKPCRSLRKSEQIPIEAKPAPIPANSLLPTHRHSAEEIEEIRRREMLSQMTPTPPNPKFRAAHPALIAVGYVVSAAGSTIFWREDFPWAATIACCVAALLHALYLFLRTPVSRHHAGFISLIAVMVAVFASLQQFPLLQHGT